MRFALGCAVLLLLAGCGGPAKNPLTGTWVVREKNVPDPLQNRLRILPDGSFLMGGGILPIRIGKATLSGADVTLTPREVKGVTDQVKSGSTDPLKPITGKLAEDGKVLTLDDASEKSGKKKLERQEAPAPGSKAVTAKEEPFVGRYKAEVDWSQVPTDSKPMLEAIQPFFLAELRADHTFLLDVAFPMDGTWSLIEGKDQIKFNFKVGGNSVAMDAKNGRLSTPAAEGAKSPYFFKKVE